MESGLLSTIFGAPASDEAGVSCYFECTACRSTFGEWRSPCPECGRLVVRVVDPHSPGGV